MKTIHDVPVSKDYPHAIFTVGQGATMYGYSDGHAGTVVEVSKNGKRVSVQRDKATLLNGDELEFHVGGFSAHCSNQHCQKYSYERNENGSIDTYTIRKWRGRYVWTVLNTVPNGRQQLSDGRRELYDYNF